MTAARIRFSLALAALLAPCSFLWAQPAEKIPVILDCDIGTDIDDTFALALALLSPELDLRGVTTVSGDTRTRAVMACRLLSSANRRNVPVAAGEAEKPPQALRGFQGQYARHPAAAFGRTGQPVMEKAVQFLYKQLRAQQGKITLVAVGPLTNIAELITKYPDCKPWIKRLVIMGGSVRVGYNDMPPAQAEFNIRADPKAAQIVFRSDIPLTVAPLDATTMLKLDPDMLKKIFSAGTLLNENVQCLYQLWDQKGAPTMYDPVAVTLAFTERFCKMENLYLTVDDKGFTREGTGRPNARVATGIKKDEYLAWFVERFAAKGPDRPMKAPVNVAQLIPRTGMPNRVHVFEDFETNIEQRWWMSGKPETANVAPGRGRACRGVLTQDFDGQMGNLATMYTAVVFNPVPGPPMGKNPRLSFRYWLKGTDTLRIQIYSLTNGYHRHLTLTGLPQEKWEEGTVDMTAVRRPNGSGGPLGEDERIDDIQFYTDPTAELIIDDIVLYDAAEKTEKRPFPNNFQFTGWFDTGKQGGEWPGKFEIVPKRGHFWNAARSVDNPDLGGPAIRIGLRGERPLGETAHLTFRYQLNGAKSLKVVLVNRTTKENHTVELKDLVTGKWGTATVDFSADGAPDKLKKGDHVDEFYFVVPAGGELLLDDVLLFEPGLTPS